MKNIKPVALKFLRDIHPGQRPGKDANPCFIGCPTNPSTHKSISLGKYFKEQFAKLKQ